MTVQTTPPTRRWAFGLSLACAIAYYLCPVGYMTESACTCLSAEALLDHGDLRLDAYANLPHGGQLYTLRGSRAAGIYLLNPPGTVFAIAPLVGAARLGGWSCVGPQGQWLPAVEENFHRLAGAVLAGLTAGVFFLIGREMLEFRPAAILALSAAFATQMLSSISRDLSSQTWLVALVSVAVLLLLRGRFLWLSTVLSWAFFCRPTAAVPIVCIAVYVAVYHRRHFWMFAAVGLFWLGAFVWWSLAVFDAPLPRYYWQLTECDAEDGPPGFALWRIGNALLSPSRGLLVCVPVSVFAAYLGARSAPPLRRWSVLAAACIGLHLLMLGRHAAGPGGCFGARYTADLAPWFVLLASAGIASRPRLGRLEKALGLLTLAIGLVINAIGACSISAKVWNETQPNWASSSWADAQWLSPFREAPSRPQGPPAAGR